MTCVCFLINYTLLFHYLQMGKNNRKGKSEVLDTHKLDKLIHFLPQTHHKLIASICRYTACRIGEAVQLTWEDIRNYGNKYKIYFPKEITKGKLNPREIPIPEELYDQLMQFKVECSHLKAENIEPKCYLFKSRNPNEHFSVRGFQHALKAALERSNVIGASSHSFRRTCLTTAHNGKAPLRHLMEISGHKSLKTLQEYLDVTDEDKDKVVNLFV